MFLNTLLKFLGPPDSKTTDQRLSTQIVWVKETFWVKVFVSLQKFGSTKITGQEIWFKEIFWVKIFGSLQKPGSKKHFGSMQKFA